MSNRFLLAALTLVAVLPTLAMAQAEPAQREGSWEFSAGAGAMYLDGHLAGALRNRGFADSGSNVKRLMPAAAVRLGYNFNNNIGFSIGTGGAIGSGVKYLVPFAALTYTVNLNATTSPFLTAGTQFTRITGNGRVTHPTWGAHAGLGVRHMVSEYLALRLEGRMGFEHYQDLPGKKTAYNSVATLGISYFTEGRRAPPLAMAAPPCRCPPTRVDTVRLAVPKLPPPPPIVLRDTLVLEGVNFDFDKSDLTPESNAILDRVVQALLDPQWSNTRWEIGGHTSSIATKEYNMALSQRRAEAVRAYLVARGVPNSRLVARGYGEEYPMYPNDSEGRNWQNRRVALVRLKP